MQKWMSSGSSQSRFTCQSGSSREENLADREGGARQSQHGAAPFRHFHPLCDLSSRTLTLQAPSSFPLHKPLELARTAPTSSRQPRQQAPTSHGNARSLFRFIIITPGGPYGFSSRNCIYVTNGSHLGNSHQRVRQ